MVRPLTLLAVAALLFTSACSDSNDAPADTPENTGSSTSTEQTSQTGSSSSTAIAGEESESSDQDSLILRYNKGEKYRYRATQASTSVQDSVSATTRSTHIYTKEILGVTPAGEYMVNMTFTEIKQLGVEPADCTAEFSIQGSSLLVALFIRCNARVFISLQHGIDQ